MKALIVDDEEISRNMLELFLIKMGISVYIAKSGEEALEKLSELKPDFCFLDLVMPGKDGFSVAKELKEKFPECPIIFISGLCEKEIIKKGISIGDEYITKPINFSNLQGVVNSTIKKILAKR